MVQHLADLTGEGLAILHPNQITIGSAVFAQYKGTDTQTPATCDSCRNGRHTHGVRARRPNHNNNKSLSNGSHGPHHRRARIVQSYSPDGARMYLHLICGFIGPRESASQTTSQSVQPRFCRTRCRDQHTNTETDLQTDHDMCNICSNSSHLAAVLAMRPNNNYESHHWKSHRPPVLWMTSCFHIKIRRR